jgi:hypothetical protein
MSASTAHEIGIVHYPGAQVACILGLTDLFGVASTIALDQRRSGQSPLRVTHWQPLRSRDANLSCVYDSAPRGSPKPRTLIIPPTMVNLPDPDVPAGVVSWVRNRHAAGATLVSLCSGAFILAETGLVDGKPPAPPRGFSTLMPSRRKAQPAASKATTLSGAGAAGAAFPSVTRVHVGYPIRGRPHQNGGLEGREGRRRGMNVFCGAARTARA